MQKHGSEPSKEDLKTMRGIGARMKKMRFSLRLTVQEAAKIMKISVEELNEIEAGRVIPHLIQWERFVQIPGVLRCLSDDDGLAIKPGWYVMKVDSMMRY